MECLSGKIVALYGVVFIGSIPIDKVVCLQGTGLGGTVDTGNIILWGTSFSGGHAVYIASRTRDPSIAAVVAMEPALTTRPAALHSAYRHIHHAGGILRCNQL